MEEQKLMDALNEVMDKGLEAFKQDLATVRTGRASVSLLDKVFVEAYGAKTPLGHVASMTVLEPRVLGVQVWDVANIKAVEKAIAETVQITPITEGNLMKVVMPELNQETRDNLSKVASGYAERARVGLRNIRREFLDKVKAAEKDGEISEDDMHRMQGRVNKETSKFVSQVDSLLEEKEKRIHTV